MSKTVLITGGSRGIGRACVEKFAAEGYLVAFTYRKNRDDAAKVMRQFSRNQIKSYQLDLADPLAIKKTVETVINDFGSIDVLVNNAGIFKEHKIAEVNYEQWQAAWSEIMNVNLIGLSNITFLVAKHMIGLKKGRIIHVSSRGAFRGEPDFPAYGASKGGLNSFSQSLAKALGSHNISVTAVAPGFVETDMARETLESSKGSDIRKESPYNRVAKPEEIADTIFYLASDSSSFLTGGIIDINGASFLRM